MSVPEIRKGDFVYRDTLFVDPGGDKRHPRATVAELKHLLIPKKGQIPPKDQVAHWYEAQLLHYGLPRSKDKNTAKVRLTTAIAGGSLAVPPAILQIEADMKKDFAAANRKAKAAAKKASEAEPAPKSKKRKADATDEVKTASSHTKVSITAGDFTVSIEHQGSNASESKKRKIATATSKKLPKKALSTSATSAKEKKPADSSTAKASITSVKEKKPATAPKKSASTAQASTPSTATKSSKLTTQTSTTPNHKPMPKQTARRGGKAPTCKPQTPKPKYETDIKDEDEDVIMDDTSLYDTSAHSYKHSHSPTPSSIIQISGTYAISTSNNTPSALTLLKNPHTSQFWGSFLVASYQGILHIPDTNGLTDQQPVRFYWRAQDESGRLYFRREQDGWMQFDGRGGVRGQWNGLFGDEDLEFQGYLDGEPDVGVEELVDRWDWYVRAAYGS